MSESAEHSRLRGSRSTSRRPNASRASSNHALLSDPHVAVFSEGGMTEEAAELLHEFVHPHRHQLEETLIGEEPEEFDEVAVELQERSRLPWWKRPSPAWVLVGMPLSSMAFGATMAPRIEIYTQLACAVHSPDVFNRQHESSTSFILPGSTVMGSQTHHQDADGTVVTFDRDVEDYAHTQAQAGGRSACASDPAVQRAVAKLSAVMAATMGVLGCLTTAWWGSFSDRIGRTTVLGIAIVGLLSNDFIFLLVFHFYASLPGGYNFLILGPVIEGFLGGLATSMTAMHAYLADTTTSANRSRVFSLSLGLLFTGMGAGPTLGGLLIRLSGNILSVFYYATGIHCLYALLVWLVLPESLTKAQRRISGELYKESKKYEGQSAGMIWLKRIFGFLTPLSTFAPAAIPSGNPLKSPRRDWNLTLVALAYGSTLTLIGSYSYKFQYAAAQFDWDSEKIGYWLSLVGATRAVFLTLILPIIIKFWGGKTLKKPVQEAEPLLSDPDDPDEAAASSSRSSSKSFHLKPHSSTFDLGLARVSLLIDLVGYLLMGLATSSLPFAAASMLGSIGAGFSPSLQSVALELYTSRGGTESGRLFGALSVVQAVCSQIIGPPLYGAIFVQSVSVFPSAIFYVGMFSISVSFVLLSFVRLQNPQHHPDNQDLEETPERVREATLVDVRDDTPTIKITPST